MPREDDPRVVVRMTPAGYAIVKAAAESVNVEVGGLMRECAERNAASVAKEIAAGRITGMRRAKVDRAVKAVRGQVVPARSLVVESEHDRLMRERQERVNALGKPKAPVRRQVP